MLFPFIEVMSDFKKRTLEIFGMPVGVGVGVLRGGLRGADDRNERDFSDAGGL